MWTHGDSWWTWGLMLTGTIGLWVLVALTVQALLTDRPATPPERGARRLLDLRLARGEIDGAEYRRLRDVLERP